MNKKLIILRGYPGSGKSTKAQKIMETSKCISVDICSADNYFIRPDGTYDWNPKLLKNAHQWCKEEVEKAMSTGHEIFGPADLIILDNTNIRKKNYQPYIEMADKYDYEVEEIIIGEFTKEAIEECGKRNIHNVPLETIKRMAENFEK